MSRPRTTSESEPASAPEPDPVSEPTSAPASESGPEPAPAPAPEPAPPETAPLKVRAIADGYYAERYIRSGDVFTLFEGRRMMGKWMEEVAPETPENITSSNEVLDRLRAEHLATMRPGGSAGILTATGDKSVLG